MYIFRVNSPFNFMQDIMDSLKYQAIIVKTVMFTCWFRDHSRMSMSGLFSL